MTAGGNETVRDVLGRVPGRYLYGVPMVVLLVLLGVQTARLVWTGVAPIGPVGDWNDRAASDQNTPDAAILTTYDPFSQIMSSGQIIVSSANLDVFGTRVDNVSGRGSAIIADQDGVQRSFFVGDEIMPGVTLHAVAFDSVTILRNGVLEQLFLDQSVPARSVAPPEAAAAPVAGASGYSDDPDPDAVRTFANIVSQPRKQSGKVRGAVLQPSGDGEMFRQFGLQPGDVLLSMNGIPVDTEARAGNLAELVGDSDVVNAEIERDGKVRNLTFAVVP